jgi:penicillin amidase
LLRRLLLLVIFLALAAGLTAWLLLRASLPNLNGQIAAGGLTKPATIDRDALGTATIHAASRNDALYALGFVHAQERYFEMDLMRRLAAGELSELVGSAAIEMDKRHRPLRMRAHAEAALSAMTAEDRATLAAYRDGINAGLNALASRPWEYWLLGSPPAAWRDADSLLAGDAMFIDLHDPQNARELAFSKVKATLGDNVYKFLSIHGGPWDAPLLGPAMKYPELPTAADIDLSKVDAKLLRMPPPPVERTATPGSNSFAVNGELTATHAALIANDMHLHYRVPSIWFRTRLIYPSSRRQGENVDLTGVTIAGIPGLIAGSNRHVAWGLTNGYGDWVDWVRVTLDPSNPAQYRTAKGWQALLQSEEVIKVHNGADVKLALRDTQWGPITAEDADGVPLALAWTVLQPGGLNFSFMQMDTAETVDEAIDIANASCLPGQNFVVGDRAGNIGWTIAGRIPKRIGGFDPLLPSDWSQPGTGWDGWLDSKDYPRLPNPPQKRLWTANARTLDFISEDFAKVGDGGFDLGARAHAIEDDLMAKDHFTPDDMLAIQLDDRNRLFGNWHALLKNVLAKAGDTAPFADMNAHLADWNGHANPASVAYRLVREFRKEVLDTVLDGFAAAVRVKYKDFKLPTLPQAEAMVDAILVNRPANLLPPGYADWNELLRKCAERVGQRLSAQPGGIAARTWGEENAARVHHPLSGALPALRWLIDMPALALPGDSNVPRVAAPTFGASERFAVEPGHEEYGYFHMPGGQSDNPLSPFYGAGEADWATGKATPFLPGAIKYTLTLAPRDASTPTSPTR